MKKQVAFWFTISSLVFAMMVAAVAFNISASAVRVGDSVKTTTALSNDNDDGTDEIMHSNADDSAAFFTMIAMIAATVTIVLALFSGSLNFKFSKKVKKAIKAVLKTHPPKTSTEEEGKDPPQDRTKIIALKWCVVLFLCILASIVLVRAI